MSTQTCTNSRETHCEQVYMIYLRPYPLFLGGSPRYQSYVEQLWQVSQQLCFCFVAWAVRQIQSKFSGSPPSVFFSRPSSYVKGWSDFSQCVYSLAVCFELSHFAHSTDPARKRFTPISFAIFKSSYDPRYYRVLRRPTSSSRRYPCPQRISVLPNHPAGHRIIVLGKFVKLKQIGDTDWQARSVRGNVHFAGW